MRPLVFARTVLVAGLAAVALGGVFAVARARGAGEWLPVREDASANPGALVDPGLAFSSDGEGVLARLIEGENPSPVYGRLGPDRLTFAGHHALGPSNEDLRERYFAAYGHSRLAVAQLAPPRRTSRISRRLGVAFVSIGRAAGRVRPVGPERQIDDAEKVVASPRGDIALAATFSVAPFRRPQQSAVYLAQRSPGRAFRAPVRVSPVGHLLGFDVATNARGDVVVAWRRSDSVEARIVTRGGRLRPLQRLGTASRPAYIRAAIGSARQAVVVWEGQRAAPGPEPRRVVGPTVARVATAGPGGRFRKASTLERFVDPGAWLGACGSPRTVDATVAGAGAPIVAWTGRVAGHFAVRVATPTGVQTLSASSGDACLGGMAVGSNGAATVVWSQGSRFSGAEVQAAVRAPGAARFADAEVVGEGAIFPAHVAIDPRLGRPFAAWYALDRIRYTSRRAPGA